MLQRLLIALAQVKAGNTCESLQIKSDKSYVLCVKKKNYWKSI